MNHLQQIRFGLIVVFCFIAIGNTVVRAAHLNIKRRTATPTTAGTTITTTTTPTTEVTSELTSTHRPPVIISNKIPTVDVSCMVRYKCAEKLKGATVAPKPCVKYCVKFIECPNAPKIRGAADHCYELDQTAVREEYEKAIKGDSTINVMRVAMIDFPCRPGFLPDDMGRCREIW